MSWELRLEDVYKIARTVGEQFQNLISQFGANSVSQLAPPVIDALERLEMYVENHEKLHSQNCKLMLELDTAARAREENARLSAENKDLLEELQRKEKECKQLLAQVQKAQDKNEHLKRKAEFLKMRKGYQSSSESSDKDDTGIGLATDHKTDVTVSIQSASLPRHGYHQEMNPQQYQFTAALFQPIIKAKILPSDISGGEVLAKERMSRKMSVMEEELKSTQRELERLRKFEAESYTLRNEIDELRAEAALQHFQLHVCPILEPQNEVAPKFFKRDLLAVLKEKNKLKEQLETVSDELTTARTELRKFEAQRTISRVRSETRVREIFDSITESLQGSNS